MNTIISWLSAHTLWWHWVIVALLPQLIVIFSAAPNGTKFTDALKVFLQILTVVDHQLTGFKLPLVTSAMSKRILAKKILPVVPPAACLLMLFSLISCSFWSTKAGTNISGVISCTESKVADQALAILGKVATALASNNYEAALGQIVAELPADIAQAAVACAVQQNISHAQEASSTGDNIAATIKTNGNAWLSKHNVQFAK